MMIDIHQPGYFVHRQFTVASCINGLIPFAYPGQSTGKLLVDGKEVKESSIFEMSRSVGTVLQDTDGQFIGLTVGEDIAFALENECVDQEQMKLPVDEISGVTVTPAYFSAVRYSGSRMPCSVSKAEHNSSSGL